MNERTDNPRRKADCWKPGPVFSKMIDDTNNNDHNGLEKDTQEEIQTETNFQIFHNETTLGNTNKNLLQANPEHQRKKYSRTLSETNVGYRAVGSTAKLKRVLSATELKTSLAGCPKGLLIATEPPKSGESYRRRSNTDIRTASVKKHRSKNDETLGDGFYQETTHFQQEKEIILLELTTVKREREQLQKENERLQQELENRNKVIDHLIDFMKSSLPGESQELKDNFNETLTHNSINITESVDKV